MTNVTTCPGCSGRSSCHVGPKCEGVSGTIAGQLFSQPPFFVKLCNDCGLLFKDTTADAETLGSYYALVDHTKWESPTLYPTERLLMHHISRLPQGARVLDFGCSSGRLLSQAPSRVSRYGLEINDKAAAIACSRGISMLSPEALKTEYHTFFDAIILSDVFEHLDSPKPVLTTLLASLRPNGKLLICTGCGDAPAIHNDPANFWYFRNIEHLIMLTRRYAEYMCREFNITLDKWHRCSHYDFNPREYLFQYLRDFAYRTTRHKSGAMHLLTSRVPLLRRAHRWTMRPHFVLSRDHIVAVFSQR